MEDYADKVSRIVKAVRKDAVFKQLSSVFAENAIFNLNCDALLEELEEAHKLRPVRTLLFKDTGFAAKVVEANIKDQAERSRAVAVLVQVSRAHRRLTAAVEDLRGHLSIEFHETLAQFRLKEDRTVVLDKALARFDRYLVRLAEVMEAANFIVKDIDQAAFSLKRNIEVLELSTQRENRV